MSEDKILSVSDFLSLVNETLRLIPANAYVVEGEVSDFRISQGKWATFDLKDENADVKAPCFAVLYRLGMPIQNGMRVRVRGQAKVFERFGKFSFNVDEVVPVGEGALQKAYLALKKKLEDEGIFSLGRKRSLPQFPERIGLITSKEAAAYGDFLRILGNRCGGLTVMHANVHVQGQYAVDEIVEAFLMINSIPEADRPEVIILTRGGGSLEDLHAFNDERVVRAIFSSLIPVVVGVGHERDESLCDFVADVRASTPSNAAEMLMQDRRELLRTVELSSDRMSYRLEQAIKWAESENDRAIRVFEAAVSRAMGSIDALVTRFAYSFDRFRLSLLATREYIERREAYVGTAYALTLERAGQGVSSLERVLASVDPRQVLKRGYAIVRRKGKILTGLETLAPGERISVQLSEKEITAEIVNEKQDTLL
jgi:exodeoxyribonuclease VII large subunit